MNREVMPALLSVVIWRGLFVCGLLLGPAGCLEHAPSVPVGVPTLSASLVQQAYAKASNPGANDQFSFQVALDGDTLAVGAWQEDSAATGVNGNQSDNSATDSGAVYVVTRTGGIWSQQAYLKASNTDGNDLFGSAVSLSGDTLVVGSYQEGSAAIGINGDQADNSAPQSGAAYVFR